MVPFLTPLANSTRWKAATYGSRSMRPAPRLLRRHLDRLDLRPEGQGRQDHQRPLRVPAERRGRHYPPQGDACDSDDAGPGRDLDDGSSGRGLEAAAPAFGWLAQNRRPRRQGRSGRATDVTIEDDEDQAAACNHLTPFSSQSMSSISPGRIFDRATSRSNHAARSLPAHALGGKGGHRQACFAPADGANK